MGNDRKAKAKGCSQSSNTKSKTTKVPNLLIEKQKNMFDLDWNTLLSLAQCLWC